MAIIHDRDADTLLLLCRAGFEADCAAELTERAAGQGQGGYARATREAGWLTWHQPGQPVAALMPRTLHSGGLVFARTAWPVLGHFEDLPQHDRISPLLAQVAPAGPFSALRLEHADTNTGRTLQRFLRGFRKALEPALKKAQLWDESADRILHLFFEDSGRGLFGCAAAASVSPWEQGIPRLRLPAAAPSRSALKLEEAWLRLMSDTEQAHWLAAGRTAVDLGAAPGGWTWQLARRGLRVTGVDHGRLAAHLLDEYPVSHVSADAFTWRPPRPVDVLVCDIVDKPSRSLALMEKWLVRGWAKVALFNLKLPMKQRQATVSSLLARLEASLAEAGLTMQIRAAQLYHDREEITVVVLPGQGGA
ncbi:23S rRNA (cytidine(2498)-2'-O)-methyltransferase RlmM [Isoalcanivorax indicus]|uniref:23S rRNA (cytidine(2498)-2'-O)-methyltransferase RlmM n=1 Tax=Isoalcanivorax indicus TaxID=2202653 RepID=UPI000DB94632|nr:23S rRNA (cytidine(2498)-2'-O)-methyltransferase RlmM [Isoalcanivorax indicus]